MSIERSCFCRRRDMARNQSLAQLRVAQRRGRRHDRNVGVTQACLDELRRHAAGRTARGISMNTGYPVKAVKNALHHLQMVIGGVSSSGTSNGTERVYALYAAPVRNVNPDDFSRAAPIVVGRGSRWYVEFI